MKKEDNIIIKYNNLIEKLSNAGYNTTRIRKERIFSEATLTSLRNNKDVNLRTLVKISLLTNIPIQFLFEYEYK